MHWTTAVMVALGAPALVTLLAFTSVRTVVPGLLYVVAIILATVVGGRIGSMVTYVGGSHPQPIETTGQLSVSLDLLAPLGTLLLVAAAVLIWPQAAPMQPRRAASGQLLAGLREYVARRG
jgi:MFS superfamily sulfate permease-like transporter